MRYSVTGSWKHDPDAVSVVHESGTDSWMYDPGTVSGIRDSGSWHVMHASISVSVVHYSDALRGGMISR